MDTFCKCVAFFAAWLALFNTFDITRLKKGHDAQSVRMAEHEKTLDALTAPSTPDENELRGLRESVQLNDDHIRDLSAILAERLPDTPEKSL